MNEVMNNKVIVIGGNHYNTLWTIRSLGFMGCCPYLIVISEGHSFVAQSKFVKRSWIVRSECQILDVLRGNFKTEELPPVIITTSDPCVELIDQNYSWLSERFILPNIDNRANQISYWMDKNIMLKAARQAGFSIPAVWHISLDKGVSDENNIPADIMFPCILKPLKSSRGTKYDFNICNNKEELIEAFHKVEKHTSEIILQEYLEPDFEISFIAAILPNAKKNIIPGVQYKLKTCQAIQSLGMPTFSCVKPGLEPYVDISVVNKFFEIIKYSGVYSIEFLISNRKAYFLEVNLRTDSDMFIYTAAGVNLPFLWVMDVTGNDISGLPQQVERITYGMTEVSFIKYLKWPAFFQSFKEWWQTDCYSIFSWKDLRPFFFKFIYYLKD